MRYLKTCTPTILRMPRRSIILDFYLEHDFLEKFSLQNCLCKASLVARLTNHKETGKRKIRTTNPERATVTTDQQKNSESGIWEWNKGSQI